MSTKDKIMDSAEGYIRSHGFNNFSFRDIAADIGIKSASVHYHFPTKDALGEAVTERYIEKVMIFLSDPVTAAASAEDGAERFISLFRNALRVEEQMCLCGMLAAEIDSLNEPVKAVVRTFFNEIEGWLGAFLASNHPEQSQDVIRGRARSAIAALEGALLMARTLQDVTVFEDVATRIKMGLSR